MIRMLTKLTGGKPHGSAMYAVARNKVDILIYCGGIAFHTYNT